MAKNESVKKIRRDLENVRTASDALKIIDAIEYSTKYESLDKAKALNFLFTSLQFIKDLTKENLETAKNVITNNLLPIALKATDEKNENLQIEYRRFRELLASWIEQYQELDKEKLRVEVLDSLCEALETEDTKAACWTISSIGYRSDPVLHKLWKIAEGGGENSQTALSTIVSLGVPTKDRNRAITALVTLATRPIHNTLLNVLHELADKQTLALVLQTTSSLESNEIAKFLDQWLFALSILSRIADWNSEDYELQNKVWIRIANLRDRHPDELRRLVYLGGYLGPTCNTDKVVHDFLRWISEPLSSQYDRNLCYLRLQECVRPRQLEGWKDTAILKSIPILYKDACLDTKVEGRSPTEEIGLKQSAWDIALSLGVEDPLEWIEQAVSGETNLYLQRWLMDLMACFAVQKLPQYVECLITEEFDARERKDEAELVARMAAVRLAHSAASHQAFDALLNFGLTHQGKVLVCSAEALADVSLALVGSGNTEITERLFDTALYSPIDRHRTTAINALRNLALEGLLEQGFAENLKRLSIDESLEPYVRSKALEALGFLPKGSIQDDFISTLINLAISDEEDELGWRAIEILARNKGLTSDYDKRITNRLALLKRGDYWSVVRGKGINSWQAFIIGILYKGNPEAFAPAVACIIREADAEPVYQLLHQVTSVPSPPKNRQNTASILIEALIERIRSKITRYSVEINLFSVLGQLDSDRLVEESWEEIWNNWHPEARVAFADAISEISIVKPEIVSRAIALLSALMGDSTYAVRRAAYRSLATVKLGALKDLCNQWAQASSVENRKRAAEALSWVLTENKNDEEISILDELLSDREKSVREAGKRARIESRERSWAKQYLEKALQVKGTGNKDMLDAYRYGRALSRIGDDQDKRRLQYYVAKATLPPHVRHWVNRLIKSIEDRWRNITRKWPEPWIGWEGLVEELDGQLAVGGKKLFDAHFSLWRKVKVSPSDKGEWGGAVWPRSEWQSVTLSMPISEIRIEIPGRKSVLAFVKTYELGGIFVIVGKGDYPFRF